MMEDNFLQLHPLFAPLEPKTVLQGDDDFLPNPKEFSIPQQRDRSFSWDVSFEEGINADGLQQLLPSYITGLGPTSSSSSGNAFADRQMHPFQLGQFPLSRKRDSMGQPLILGDYASLTTDQGSDHLQEYISEPLEYTSPFAESYECLPHLENHISSGIVERSLDTYLLPHPMYAPPQMMHDYPYSMQPPLPLPAMAVSVCSDYSMLGMNQPTEKQMSFNPICMPHLGHGHILPQSVQMISELTNPADPYAASAKSHPGISLYDTLSVNLLPPYHVNPEVRIGAYTREERQMRIDRFRAKKLKRIWRKQIKYDCRKRLADTRPRVKGRFVSRAERAAAASRGESLDDGDLDDCLDGRDGVDGNGEADAEDITSEGTSAGGLSSDAGTSSMSDVPLNVDVGFSVDGVLDSRYLSSHPLGDHLQLSGGHSLAYDSSAFGSTLYGTDGSDISRFLSGVGEHCDFDSDALRAPLDRSTGLDSHIEFDTHNSHSSMLPTHLSMMAYPNGNFNGLLSIHGGSSLLSVDVSTDMCRSRSEPGSVADGGGDGISRDRGRGGGLGGDDSGPHYYHRQDLQLTSCSGYGLANLDDAMEEIGRLVAEHGDSLAL